MLCLLNFFFLSYQGSRTYIFGNGRRVEEVYVTRHSWCHNYNHASPHGRMLAFSRFLTLRLNRPPLLQWTRKYSSKPNYTLPEPPHIESLETTEDSTQARAWLARFKQEQIPRSLVDLTFSRSSGPGGQVRMLCVTLTGHWMTRRLGTV